MQITRAADAKEIVFDNLSRKRMQDGINKLADAVGVTLGPRGELVMLCSSISAIEGSRTVQVGRPFPPLSPPPSPPLHLSPSLPPTLSLSLSLPCLSLPPSLTFNFPLWLVTFDSHTRRLLHDGTIFWACCTCIGTCVNIRVCRC